MDGEISFPKCFFRLFFFFNLKALTQSWSKRKMRDFPGGPVIKNLPSSPGDMGLSPGRGTGIPHVAGQLSPRALEPVRHS